MSAIVAGSSGWPRRRTSAGDKLADVALRRPSLDDVFLALTGHAAEERTDGEQDGQGEKKRGRRRE